MKKRNETEIQAVGDSLKGTRTIIAKEFGWDALNDFNRWINGMLRASADGSTPSHVFLDFQNGSGRIGAIIENDKKYDAFDDDYFD